ncbi:MAG TPA: prolipoprotein diacylglyceryl transferase [Acidimicrobiales bacterium]|nr:prolipoprotein diacylglyceryl transferase [Acidimicrobiales bacterium]
MLGALSYNPIVKIEVGPLDLSPHGIGIAVGFLAGATLMLRAAEKKGISEDAVYSILIRALIGSIIGARLAYVLNHFSDFESPVEVFQIWKGGISLLGGIIGGIVLPCFWARRHGVSFWKGTDAAAPGLALGIVIGRIGDLIVADHLGKPTKLFLGYLCPGASIDTASPCPPGSVVHQTALYDLLLTAVLLGVLLWLRRRDRFDGFLILAFGAVYGAQRLLEDFFREDVRRFGLTGSQWTASVAVLLCLYVLLVTRRTPAWGRWDQTRTDQVEAEPTMTDDDGETPEQLPHRDAAEAEIGEKD